MPCSAKARQFLHELPKCEHHLHIEGTLEPQLLFQLADKNKIALPQQHFPSIEETIEKYKHFSCLQDFLDMYNAGMEVLIDEDDFEALTWAYLRRVHQDGLVHAEIFFDPQAHTERGVHLDTVVQGIDKALRKAHQEFGITSKLTMCFVRHLSVESALETVENMARFVKNGVVSGLGCDSTEKGNHPEKYQGIYKRARELGFPHLTGHFGEEGPAEYVRYAVETLGLQRIDHGVRSIDDPEVVKLLADKGVFVALCPLSNVALKVFPSVEAGPIKVFLDAGVKFSINSDDPSYLGGYILDNYVAVQETFSFSKKLWRELVFNSIDNSWCDAARKKELVAMLDNVMEKWTDVDID
ncbi:adenine deaminase [Microbotryomycetes sp. JL201]|nr:adenine deaminase [Microbotryomycetes sp. JL201]